MMTQAKILSTDERIWFVPSGKRLVVHAIYLANTTSSRRTVRLHHVRSGMTSGTDNALFYDVAIAPNSTLIDSTRFPMEEGESIRGKADASGVTMTLHGNYA